MNPRAIKRHTPELALLAASILWGAGFLATKTGMEYAGPLGFVALRYFAATAAVLVIFPRAIRNITSMEFVAGVLVAATAFLAYAAQAYALQIIPTGRVAFLSALYVPLVPVLQFLLFRQRVSWGIWIGVGLACVGVAVMSGVAQNGLQLAGSDLLALFGAVAIAFEVVILGWYVRRGDPIRIAFVMMLMTTLLSLLFAFAMGETMPQAVPTLLWIVLFFGMATAFIQFAMCWAQARVESSRAAIIYALEPVFGGSFGYIAGEVFGVSDVIGAIIILTGVVIASLPRIAIHRLSVPNFKIPARLTFRLSQRIAGKEPPA